MSSRIRVALLALVCATGTWAQLTGYGAISGKVRDSGGDGIPDCTVSISNPALGIAREVTTTGNSAIDQRHRGTVQWIWQPTVTHNDSPAARFLLNGWSLSGIGTIASPQYATPIVQVVGQQFSSLTMSYTNSLDGSGGWSRVPFQNVGILATGPQRNFDVRLTRMLPFTERVKGMLMFEAFDVFNTQHTTAVNTIAYQAVTVLPVGVVNGPFNGFLKPVPGLGAGIGSQAYPDGTTARRLQIAFRVVF